MFYSERLVSLLREVRQLTALGFVVPPRIQKVSATAQKFYRHGVVLKQVYLHSFSALVKTILLLDQVYQ